MVAWKELSAGNISIYQYLHEQRQPLFLQRNLFKIFRAHQDILTHGTSREPQTEQPSETSHWKPPSLDFVDQMVERASYHGSFVLDVLRLVPLHRSNALRLENAQRQVKKTRSSALAGCGIRLLVIRDDGKKSNVPSCEANLHRSMTQQSTIDVDADRMVISGSDLASGRRSSKVTAKFKMVLSLNFTTEHDARVVFDHIGLDKMPSASTRLEAKYSDIAEMAFKKTTLRLTDIVTNEAVVGLDVTIGRVDTQDESILQSHNRHQRNLRQSAPVISCHVPPTEPEKYRIRYLWPNDKDRQTTVDNLRCYQQQCGRILSSVNELMMHLRNSHYLHDHDCRDNGIDAMDIHEYVILCTVAYTEFTGRASDRAEDPSHITVVAPEQPFDIEKSVKGDLSWENTARNPRTAKSSVSKTTSNQPGGIAAGPRRKAPEEVVARSHGARRTFVVPRPPPGVTFFSSNTKQPMRVGAQLSESDDEVDEEWLHLRKDTEVDKEQIPDSRKRFLKKFHACIGEETLQSDVHMGDAMIRFVRQEAEWIWTAAVFDDFHQKLRELCEDGIIIKEIYDASLQAVKSKKPRQHAKRLSRSLAQLEVGPETSSSVTTRSSPSWPRRDRKGKGKAVLSDQEQIVTPANTDSDGDVAMQESSHSADTEPTPASKQNETEPCFDLCYCGQDALSSTTISRSPAIMCSSLDCVRRAFHIECVKKHTNTPTQISDLRKRTWMCDECKDASPTGS